MASQEQMARAARCAISLGAPSPVPRGLYRALLSLVESVERPYTKAELEKPPPVSDARKVLAPVRTAAPKKTKRTKQPIQEGLW